MVPRALRTENLKPAILFRVVEKHRPTLLLDEVDTYLAPDLELRGLLNAGHKRGGCALRYESGGVRSFSAFSPAALGGIGPLPITLHNRSIVIPLVPALPGEVMHIFDPENVEIETIIGRKLARWALDNFETLRKFKPVLPPAAYNRLADNWRPLFAIAQLAGGDWPERALEAFTSLAVNARKTQSISVMLLADIRDIFAELHVERIASKQLVEELCNLVDRPWTEVNRKGSISERWLALQLRRFDIAPQASRIGETRARSYDLVSFTEAFARYLPE